MIVYFYNKLDISIRLKEKIPWQNQVPINTTGDLFKSGKKHIEKSRFSSNFLSWSTTQYKNEAARVNNLFGLFLLFFFFLCTSFKVRIQIFSAGIENGKYEAARKFSEWSELILEGIHHLIWVIRVAHDMASAVLDHAMTCHVNNDKRVFTSSDVCPDFSNCICEELMKIVKAELMIDFDVVDT